MISEDFECAPSLRLAAHERVMNARLEAFTTRFDRMERIMEGLERRIWMLVTGIVGLVLSQAILNILPSLF